MIIFQKDCQLLPQLLRKLQTHKDAHNWNEQEQRACFSSIYTIILMTDIIFDILLKGWKITTQYCDGRSIQDTTQSTHCTGMCLGLCFRSSECSRTEAWSWIMQLGGKQSFQHNAANKIVFFCLDIRRKGLSFFAWFNDKKLNLVLNRTF